MNITWVIGQGPNSVEIPLLAFPDEQQAKEHLWGLGLHSNTEGTTFNVFMVDGKPMDLDCVLGYGDGYGEARAWEGTPEATELLSRPDICHSELYSSEWTPPTWQVFYGPVGRLLMGLFKGGSYYGGCGECYALRLVTLPVGVPPVSWNLD